MPHNKVSIAKRTENCVDVSCYSNHWEELLGWSALSGTKFQQRVHVPVWIIENPKYTKACLRGLFMTDGSIYKDRGYLMANFTTIIQPLIEDVNQMILSLGYLSHSYTAQPTRHREHTKYVVRISKNTAQFLDTISCHKIATPYIFPTSEKPCPTNPLS
jgi:DNA-binding transcriptional regulator WhiA